MIKPFEKPKKPVSEPLETNSKVVLKVVEGPPGPPGAKPTRKELLDLIIPLIPEPIRGDDGDDYVLTKQDKQDIADSIPPVIVDKIIEKREVVIKETPVIKEVAIGQTPEEVRDKLISLKKGQKLPISAIEKLQEYLDDLIEKAGDKLKGSIRAGTTRLKRFIDMLDTPKSYVGQAGKAVVVRQDEKGVEFVSMDVSGLLDYRGAYDASVNTFPATGGSGTAGAILKGDCWAISVDGTLGGVDIQAGDMIIAAVDTPGQTTGNWNKLNTNISYVPLGETTTNTVTNKRNQPRITSAASYTTDTGSALSVATTDIFVITAQAGALLFNNPGGTPIQGEKLIIRIEDDGTARALTFDTKFRASSDLALPTTTVLGKTLYMGFIYNENDTKWDLIALLNNI